MGRRSRKKAFSGTEPCPTCGAEIQAQFCAQCGEMRPSLRLETVRDLVVHAFEAFTHLDGRLLRTVKTLVTSPGKLHADYFAGKRKPYLTPLQLFLVMNLVFFLLETTLHFQILSSPLWSQTHHQVYSRWALELADAVAKSKGLTLEQMAPAFDATVSTLSRSLVIVFVPLLALFVALIAPRRGVVSPLVFAFHFVTFLLLLECVLMGLLLVFRVIDAETLVRLNEQMDAIVSIVIGLTCLVYAWLATRRAFGHGRLRAVVSAVVIVLGLAGSLVAYRLLLFLVTLWAQR